MTESKLSKGSADVLVCADWGKGAAGVNYRAKILLLFRNLLRLNACKFPSQTNSNLGEKK